MHNTNKQKIFTALYFYAVTRIRTGVAAATTQSTNHYTITASYLATVRDQQF